MSDRPCNECIWHSKDGCTSWDCEPVTRKEARKHFSIKGKWIHESDEFWVGGGKTKCSRCGFGYADGMYHEVDEFNYCPNCGTKMEES